MLAALGSLPRLAVFRSLLRAGHEGLNVTALQSVTALPASTLKHHLAALVDSGLVAQQRTGREVNCTARFEEIRHLSGFLLRECCFDVGEALEESSEMSG
ncbi:helix-turn-helix domain-containing protein [Variovorax beijingensis]|uniref:ArsR/SmtB family transcription factor n=2 Tax=Comamonadaceae TaxID=80864 RepID=UPI001CB95E01